jgi:hypothetical protein
MGTLMEDPNQPIEGAFLQALESGPVKNLVNPVTKHLGETLGYIGDIVRFYSHLNLAKIFTKWAEAERGGKSLEEEEFKRVMPLLPLAAQVADDELQDRWAALLESAAQGQPGFLPSFGQTLSQMTAEEARFLEKIHHEVHRKERETPVALDEESLLHLFDPSIGSFFYALYAGTLSVQALPEGSADRLSSEKGLSMIQDLERLGILVKSPIEIGPGEYIDAPQSMGLRYAGMKILARRSPEHDRVRFQLSSYGESFLKAVSRNQRRRSGRNLDDRA